VRLGTADRGRGDSDDGVCCDDSPNRHATAHAHAASHPTIRSREPGEEWSWCYVRVHHFARQFSSPFPLLAAIGVKTGRAEIGTGVIDMRYENPKGPCGI
jgi:hypothetical protein